MNECSIAEGDLGYCGVRRNLGGTVQPIAGTEKVGWVSFYHDPLPTNCVAAWVCPECVSSEKRPIQRKRNLAVFYQSCAFDCLFCQNWHFRDGVESPSVASAREVAEACDERSACICFFGGGPLTQLDHALAVAREALAARPTNPPRICWETNGSACRSALRKVVEISMKTGGIIKFDLKAWNESLHEALTGCSNRNTLRNFAEIAGEFTVRPDPPLLIVSTLLIPGYVEETEVREIARFIAELDPGIPYSLLAFHPDYLLSDLPVTSRAQAQSCLAACVEEGLINVNIGNRHLLV
jgi:pyruvate formate lyase activating enzyme